MTVISVYTNLGFHKINTHTHMQLVESRHISHPVCLIDILASSHLPPLLVSYLFVCPSTWVVI